MGLRDILSAFRPASRSSIPTENGAADWSRRLSDHKVEALRAGGGSLLDYSNVAPGSRGYALYALEMDGLATISHERIRLDPITWGTRTTFTLTEAGKRAAAMLQD